MTKAQKTKNVMKLSDAQAKEVLRDIVVECIHEGRKLSMTSSEILDGICDTLRAVNCDDAAV